MTTETLIDSETVKAEPDVAGGAPATPDPLPDDPESEVSDSVEGQAKPDGHDGSDGPDDGQPSGVSERKRTANRANSAKSTGPTSKMGKRIASHNSFKNGYYSNERRLQLMGELDEDPADRERLRKDLYATYPPGAPLEDILLDGLTDDFWKRGQLDRLDASVKLRELERADLDECRRDDQTHSFALDATRSQVGKGGLVGQKDSAGKFKLVLDVLRDLLRRAESRNLSCDHSYLWKVLYGTDDPNWYGERVFARIDEGQTGEDVNYKGVTTFLKQELDAYSRMQARYLMEHQEETVASREARLVTCGGDALILFKEMEVTDRQIDRKLQLLLKVRAERFAREKEEGSGQSAVGSQQLADEGGPDGNGGGSAEIPPRKPVQSGSGQSAEGSRQSAEGSPQEAEGTSRFGKNGTFDLQPSTFDFSKNEATDLLENKASVSAQIRNEATVETSRQSAEGSRPSEENSPQEAPSSARQAARLGRNCAFVFDSSNNQTTVGTELPTADCQPPTAFCILTGEESSALAGELLCARNRRRPIGPVGTLPCRALGSKHSRHVSGGQPLLDGRADGATTALAADGRGPGVDRLRLRGRDRCDAVRVPLSSGPCQPPGRLRPERSHLHRRPARNNPAPHRLRPSVRPGTRIGPKRRAKQ